MALWSFDDGECLAYVDGLVNGLSPQHAVCLAEQNILIISGASRLVMVDLNSMKTVGMLQAHFGDGGAPAVHSLYTKVVRCHHGELCDLVIASYADASVHAWRLGGAKCTVEARVTIDSEGSQWFDLGVALLRKHNSSKQQSSSQPKIADSDDEMRHSSSMSSSFGSHDDGGPVVDIIVSVQATAIVLLSAHRWTVNKNGDFFFF